MISQASSYPDCESACLKVAELKGKIEELKEEKKDLKQEKQEAEKKLDYQKRGILSPIRRSERGVVGNQG
ncbi:hypothetical protein AKJ39_04565 [candidate division MSBL1 archaeon SCGC-AAA259J03]|uniref:Uncharacterized protein n=1 Tax=candidate division MSBL1 archaeon SCGC-AAA259J03 TaxID=1698269 RepID=A0A656YWT4_9EURY|nr:hypothetical protein AKJ39_04565 [candidate division MSBL1 archaeon SCGC-AAA259J03]